MRPVECNAEGSKSPTLKEDIRQAETLPASFYTDPDFYRGSLERIFARSWQFVGDTDRLKVPGQVIPLTLLEGSLNEPILLTRDREDRIHALSNVCTHRAALVCEGPGVETVLRCRYHGRRFALDGTFLSMPEFEEAVDFPSERDHLPRLALGSFRKFLFASLAPRMPLEELTQELERRVGFLPFEEALFDPSRSRDYLVRAHWALYCDNYLEGFHVPYVHAGLAQAIDYGAYRTELFRWSSLQVGIASGNEETFQLPDGHPDRGQRVVAYWFWLFPNFMFNVYPWGVSINVVLPLGIDRTRVQFLSYIWDPSKIDRSAGNALDRVEREDEAVVESVQRGIHSRMYRAGRFSPTRETGVHHFHLLLAQGLASESAPNL